MATVTWSRGALNDLRQIERWIARDSPHAAATTIARITAAARQLERFPESGRLLATRPQGIYRELISGSYRIAYRFRPRLNHIDVMAVVHGSRQSPSQPWEV